MSTPKILAIIPARAGSKRILRKNIRKFLGRPLIEYTIGQAYESGIFDRVIVDTDSSEIAKIAKKSGAEVPWLRPGELASDSSKVIDSILYLLERLKKEEKYIPSHVMILQTTSPLRETRDITACWDLMQHTHATSVVTVCATRPKPKDLAWLKQGKITGAGLAVGPGKSILHGYNGFVFLIETRALLREKTVLTKKTHAVVCDEWRSIDIDVPEEWALAEIIFKNKSELKRRLDAAKSK